MFVTAAVTIAVTAREAQARFVNLTHGPWLTGASQAAYDHGRTGLLKVGPAGSAVGKLVAVTILDPIYRGTTMRAGLRWEATGPAGALFPVLDANITIGPAEAPGEEAAPTAGQHARLELTGAYRPPLGRLGATLDQAIMRRAATATVRSLLGTIATALADPATAASRATVRPQPDTG